MNTHTTHNTLRLPKWLEHRLGQLRSHDGWHCGCLMILLVSITISSGCNSISVTSQSGSKTITQQRSNIITNQRLSSNSTALLLSAGLNQDSCLNNFEFCEQQLDDSLFANQRRAQLALIAELHYAKSQALAQSGACRLSLQRPPIDPYYANAPLTDAQAQQQQQDIDQCLSSYREHLFSSVKYSYAYLFYNALQSAQPDQPSHATKNAAAYQLISSRDIQTQDIYTAATSELLDKLYETSDSLLTGINSRYLPVQVNPNRPSSEQIKVMQFNDGQHQLDIHLPNETDYLKNASQQSNSVNDLISTYGLRLSGLGSISQRAGIGVSFVAQLDDRYTSSIRQLLTDRHKARNDDDPNSRIFPTGNLLVTGVLIPSGTSVDEVINTSHIDAHLYNPHRSDTIYILGSRYPLAGNFSASYALWLSENQLDSVGYLNLLRRQDQTVLPRLFMLEPYHPDKRVIIMLHGLASSPATWVSLTNDILSDDTLRQNYQVWQIFYATNLPILENRYQIQQLIDTAFAKTDPQGTHPASQHSVLIGHSMGAVIGRMMLSDTNLIPRLDALATSDNDIEQDISKQLKRAFGSQQIEKRFALHSLPQVDTAVFISAPFRGTDYADRWFTRAIRRIIHLPLGIVQTISTNLSSIASEGELANNPLGALYLQNGASQLSDKSSFVMLTQDIDISPRITYHSIIANQDQDLIKGLAEQEVGQVKLGIAPPSNPSSTSALFTENTANHTEALVDNKQVTAVNIEAPISQTLSQNLSDGIVPYHSSHLPGAASETIIRGGHSIQSNPQSILLLRKLLHQQLKHHPPVMSTHEEPISR